jgi:hypothetical protein
MSQLCLADLKRQNSEFRFLVADQYDCRCHTPREEPLIPLDDLVAKGEQLEQAFAAAQALLADNADYVRERRSFYCTFGDLFNDLLDYEAIQGGHPAQCVYAHKACEYYTKSAHPRGALGLAYIFTGLGFHATAAHWLGVVERIGQKVGPADTETQSLAQEAHAQLARLTANAMNADRALADCAGFPLRDTPGLIPAYQSSALPAAGAAAARPTPNGVTAAAARPASVAAAPAAPMHVDPNSHDETFRRLEQLRREERERERKIEQGLCLACGHPLRIVDKVARRHKHKECG